MPSSSKTFRIFVSSTFSDLKAERNALQCYVFPRLRDLCMQHGCRFQAIDLRWGVSEEAGRDQQTVPICLKEIERCQRVTPRPNFIILLGDRYGWRPLPAVIPEEEFNQIEEGLSEADKKLLAQWYRLDENAMPSVYCLLPRKLDVPTDASEEEHRAAAKHEREEWRDTEKQLRAILTGTIDRLGWPKDDPHRIKYETSATEQEVVDGALNVPDAKEHVFGFFRDIVVEAPDGDSRPLMEHLPADEGIKPYVDLIGAGQPDTQAVERQNSLKKRLRTDLPGNINDYTAKWTDDGITTDHIGTLPEKLDDCLNLNDAPNPQKTLCVDVWRRLSGLILKEIEQIQAVDPLTRENADHKAFGEERSRNFVGRTDILSRIQSYIDGDDNQPLVIHGKSGSGKTALMAKASEVSDAEARDRATSLLVTRYVGATPGSTELRPLISDLCRALGVAEVPQDMNELVSAFRGRLSPSEQRGEKEDGQEQPQEGHGKTILFLDALDQLSPTDNALMLYWMPRDLKPNVKFIVSVLETEPAESSESTVGAGSASSFPIPHSALRIPHSEDPYDLARRIWPESLVEIGPLDQASGADLLDMWFTRAERTLQAPQKEEVLGKFERDGMPLYLKLVFEEACGWHSYDPVSDLPGDTPGLIRFMLDRLSHPENHGAMLMSRALGYLAAAKNGLTEDELLDVLARDDDYWCDFCDRIRHTEPTLVRTDFAAQGVDDLKSVPPDQRRLPVIIWSRLYHDMARYLAERSADATTLFSFYHRQVREVVERKYLQPEDRLRSHERLAEYFATQDYWAESLEAQRARAKRLPPTPRPANIRKVVELPYHRLEAAKLGGEDDPKSPYWDKVADLLTDWQFLEAKTEANPNFREEETEEPSTDTSERET